MMMSEILSGVSTELVDRINSALGVNRVGELVLMVGKEEDLSLEQRHVFLVKTSRKRTGRDLEETLLSAHVRSNLHFFQTPCHSPSRLTNKAL